MKKRENSIYNGMLLLQIGPILFLGIILTLFSYYRFTSSMYNEVQSELRNLGEAVLLSYDREYPGDYALTDEKISDLTKGGTIITTEYEIIDKIKEKCDVEITIFYQDMRVITTLTNTDGNRIAGTFANAETAQDVLFDGEDAFYHNVAIGGRVYMAYYMPIKNSDGSIVGMISVCKMASTITQSIWNSVQPIFYIAIIVMLIAVVFAIRYAGKLVKNVQAVQVYMRQVANGNLSAGIDEAVVKRNDELGEMARSGVFMQRRLRSMIETDPLTGLSNRRFVEAAISGTIEKYKNAGEPYIVVIGDIDFFKKVNDTYGHDCGDEILKEVATVLKEEIKGKGFAARWGGEEFLLVYQNVNADVANTYVNYILRKIRMITVPCNGERVSVTMTFGIAEGSDMKFKDIVHEADDKLYYGKTHGRNQVVLDILE